MKKLLTLLITLALIVTMIAGCNTEKGSVQDEKEQEEKEQAELLTNNDIKVSEPGIFPIVEEEVTLTVMMEQNPNVSDYEMNKLTQKVEGMTGVNIEWMLVPNQDRAQKINLLLAANTDLPDIFMGSFIDLDLQQLYGEQGLFVPMNDMIKEHGIELRRVMEQEPGFENMITSADGNIYGLPQFSEQINTKVAVKAWIYTPWLDALGLEKPTTTDELYNVLKAFKTQDPNGNGVADEIPMVGAKNGWNQMPQRFLMNAFLFYDESQNGLYVDNGTIKASFNQEQFREGLRYMNRLVEEGLLDMTSWTQDRNQLKQLVESDVAVVGAVPSGGIQVFSNINGERARGFDTIEPLEGPDGTKIAWYFPHKPYTHGQFVITHECDYPLVAFKLADALYSEEISMWSRYGEPGIDYIVNPEGETNIHGEPATFKPILEWGSVQNSHWQNTGPGYISMETLDGESMADPYALNVWLNTVSLRDYYPYVTDNRIPPLVFDIEESAERAEIINSLGSYYRESMVRFILGDLDLDSDWDDYVEELQYIGLDRVIEITQEAYDKKWK